MNEFDDGCSLTKVIKAREAAIVNLKELLAESEEQYVALQQTNAENWTKCNTLEKDLGFAESARERLRQDLVGAKDEARHWREAFTKAKENAEVQEEVYLKVIKELSNRG